MKYLIILCFAASLASCAGTVSSYEFKGGPFKIHTSSDAKPIDCFILSIRDSGLVIASPMKGGSFDFNIETLRFLHKDSISEIEHTGLTGMNPIGAMIGGTAGAIVAAPAGALYGYAYDVSTTNNLLSKSAATSTTSGIFIGAALGAATCGALIGYATAPQSSFSISDPEDKETLIKLCKYCGHEPDFINAIK